MTGFRAGAGVLVGWNALGCLAFGAQWAADLEALAASDPVSAEAFAAMPAWVWAAYGTAVSTGTLAAVALLLRRRAAVGLFGISLAALVVQLSWSFLGFGIVGRAGWTAAIFPAFLLGVGALSLGWAARCAADGRIR